MAASLWWVCLCFTWFLAAALKWSKEAISKVFRVKQFRGQTFLGSSNFGVKNFSIKQFRVIHFYGLKILGSNIFMVKTFYSNDKKILESAKSALGIMGLARIQNCTGTVDGSC